MLPLKEAEDARGVWELLTGWGWQGLSGLEQGVQTTSRIFGRSPRRKLHSCWAACARALLLFEVLLVFRQNLLWSSLRFLPLALGITAGKSLTPSLHTNNRTMYRKMLQSLYNLCLSLLASFQYVRVSLVPRSPALDPAVRITMLLQLSLMEPGSS